MRNILLFILTFVMRIPICLCVFNYNMSFIRYGENISTISLTDNLATFWINRNSTFNLGSTEFVGYSYNMTAKTNYQNPMMKFYNISFDIVKQKLGQNPGLSCYILEGIVGKVCCNLNDMSKACSNWDFSSIYSSVKTAFGKNTSQLYIAFQTNTLFQFKKCLWSNSNTILQCTYLYQFSNQNIVEVQYINNLIYILSYHSLNNTLAYIRILQQGNNVLSLFLTLQYQINSISNLKMKVSPNFLVLASDHMIFVNHMYTNFSPTLNYTLDSVILNIQVSLQNLFVSISNQIRQYTFSTLSLAYTHYPNGGTICNHTLLFDWKRLTLITLKQTTHDGYIEAYTVTGGYYIYNAPFICQPFQIIEPCMQVWIVLFLCIFILNLALNPTRIILLKIYSIFFKKKSKRKQIIMSNKLVALDIQQFKEFKKTQTDQKNYKKKVILIKKH